MKAVVFHGKDDLRVEDLPEPQVHKNFVKVAPAWCGICGSDLHEWLGGPSICPTSAHPITGEKVPLTFGHEFSGVVEQVGPEANPQIKVGQRCVVQPIIYDKECGPCKQELYNCCYKGGFIGLSGYGGGLSEHIVVPDYAVFPIPDTVPLDVAALVEPLAVGWHAVKVSPFQPDNSVLVLGGGPIGLSVIQALKAKGCKQIIVSEISQKRKTFAKEFGAHVILDPTKDDIVARCKELCDGEGPHVVFDAAGVQAGLDQALLALRARGTHVNIAIWEKRCSIFPGDLLFKEKKYMGVVTYEKEDFGQVIEAIADGRLARCKEMITKRIELDEVVEEGFRALVDDKENQVKILVRASGKT